MDIKKYLPTEEMMSEFEEFSKLTTKEEKDKFDALRTERHLNKTPEEQEEYKARTLEGIMNISNRVDEFSEIIKLNEVSKVIKS